MPLNTGAALVVSLIPAAVILVYNLMEHGVPGGSLKNFIGSELAVSASASFVSPKNISINSAPSESTINSITERIKLSTTASSRLPETTTSLPTTTTPVTTTVPPINLSKLPICCDNIHVSGDRLKGNCGDADAGLHFDLLLLGKRSHTWKVPAHLMGNGVETKFYLQTSTPGCKDGKFIGQLPLSIEVTSEDHFLPDGMLKYKNEYYRPDEYCIRGNGKTDGILEVQTCKINCSNPETPCVHKCCGYDEIYSMGMKGQRGGCLRMDPSRNESLWSPSLYDENKTRLTAEQLAAAGIRPHVIQYNPTRFRHLCPRNATTVFPHGKQVADFLAVVLRYPFSALKFMLRKDGWLMNPNGSTKNVAISQSMRTTKYCIDGVQNYGEYEPFANSEDQTVLFLCLGAAEELASLSNPKGENLIAEAANNQAITISTTSVPTTTTSTTTTSTTTPTTTTTTTTTTAPTTTVTTPSTTAQTTTTSPSTTTPVSTTAKVTSTSTLASTTTNLPTTTAPPETVPTTTEPPSPPPVLPICCPLDPDANEESDNAISHHCTSPLDNAESAVDSKSSNFSSNLWIASPNFMFTHKITKFRLQVKPLKCQKWTKAFVHNLGKLLSPSEPVLMPNGMLKVGNDYFRDGEFCVNGVFPNIVEVLMCKTNCSNPQTPCIQKCCAPNEIYSLGLGGKKRGCVPLSNQDTPFNPPLYKNIADKVSQTELQTMTPHIVHKYPPRFQYNCYKNVTLVFPYSSEVLQLMTPLAQINLEFKLRQDGKVIYKHPSIRNAAGELIESAFSTQNYCIDGIRNFGEAQGPYKNDEDQTILFVCAVNPPDKPK